MATILNTNNYSKLNSDITDIMRSGFFSGVSMNIYTDAEATTFAVDGNTQFEGKKLIKLIPREHIQLHRIINSSMEL